MYLAIYYITQLVKYFKLYNDHVSFINYFLYHYMLYNMMNVKLSVIRYRYTFC